MNEPQSPFTKFDQTLTEAERVAANYLEWSDPTIARGVREIAAQIRDQMGNKAMLVRGAGQVLAGVAKEANAEVLVLDLDTVKITVQVKCDPKASLAAEHLKTICQDQLTCEKTATVAKRDGHQITGFILCHPETGERAIVELSAVRWLSKDQAWNLMHPPI